jgi:hypothetical protein
MSNRELIIVKELGELQDLECRLQRKWNNFTQAGKEVTNAFLLSLDESLDELKRRAQRLERLLGPSLPPVNDALERAA